MDEHQQRLEQLRRRRESLTASGSDEELAALDAEIAEAQGASLLGSGDPRSDTRIEGSSARCYVAAMMRQGPHGISARRLHADAVAGTRAALTRLRMCALGIHRTLVAHAGVTRSPRRAPRAHRAHRGPARAAPARPRRESLHGVRGIGLTDAYLYDLPLVGVPKPGGLPAARA